MSKKIICSFIIVAMIGISMWALIIGYVGSGTGVIMSNAITTSGENAEGNWGLSFQAEGKAPVGNATIEELKKYNAYYIDDKVGGHVDDKKAIKKVYLTFDAGYENGYTERILDVLKGEKVPATFFLVGDYIKSNPDIVKRMVNDGHIVGNHTMTHPDMAIITDKDDFKKELEDLESIYEATTGEKMKKLYRPPQGKYSESNLELAKEMGYTTFFWSLAYVDWYVDDQPTREDALSVLNSRIHDGAIVLLHSTSKTNCEILEELIKGWKQEGYSFESLESIID